MKQKKYCEKNWKIYTQNNWIYLPKLLFYYLIKSKQGFICISENSLFVNFTTMNLIKVFKNFIIKTFMLDEQIQFCFEAL